MSAKEDPMQSKEDCLEEEEVEEEGEVVVILLHHPMARVFFALILDFRSNSEFILKIQ